MEIKTDPLTKNRYSRPGVPLKAVKGIVIHWVANPGTSAQANRDYFESLKDQPPGLHPDKYRYASAHYVVGLRGEIIQCVPDSEVCYHVGAQAYANEALRRLSSYPNNCTLGIELCHPGWDGGFTGETLQSCRRLASSLLSRYGLGREDLWRHFDVTSPGKKCPLYFVEHAGEWDAFRASIQEVTGSTVKEDI
jgi:N-acetylmuramoyl-L-alanine amidase